MQKLFKQWTATKLMLPRWKRCTMTVERNMRFMPDYSCWWISQLVTVERCCCGRCREGWIFLIPTATKLMLPRWKRGTMTVDRNMRFMPDYNCWWISQLVTADRKFCGRCREGWICLIQTATKLMLPGWKRGTMTVERNMRFIPD